MQYNTIFNLLYVIFKPIYLYRNKFFEKTKINSIKDVKICIVRFLTFICRFIVIQNNVMKYITSIGQNTGMLKQSNRVHTMATTVDFVTEYQNLNSGNLLINGLNSSFDLVGSSGPSPSVILFQIKLTF